MLAGSQPKPQCKLALLEKTLHGRTSRPSNVRVHFTLFPVEISVGRTMEPAGIISQVLEHPGLSERSAHNLQGEGEEIDHQCGGSSSQGFPWVFQAQAHRQEPPSGGVSAKPRLRTFAMVPTVVRRILLFGGPGGHQDWRMTMLAGG